MSKFKIPETYFPTIKEIAFREYYFPAMLKGDKDITLEWLKEVAIRPNTKVNVLDDSTGEVLFSVPPLVRSPKTMLGSNLWDLLDTISKRMSTGHKASVLVHEGIRKAFEQEEYTEEEMKQWMFIYDRYGITERGTEDESSAASVVEEEEDWD